jgi:hypothetical protein
MLGVGHLIETERQLDIYLKNINQYVRQQQSLIDNRTESIQQRKANLDDESKENEKTLLPSAFAKVDEACELIQLNKISDSRSASSVSDAKRVIAVARGEIVRKKSEWAEKRSAEVALAADWTSRDVLVNQQSVDQERALAVTRTLVGIDAEAVSLREQLEVVEGERKQLQQALDADQALISRLQIGLQRMSGPLSRFLALPSESNVSYHDAVELSGGAPNSAILESMVDTATRARADLPGIRDDIRELNSLSVSLAEAVKSAVSADELRRTEDELTAATAQASALRLQYGRLAGPIEQLRQLSSIVVDMLSHADQCPVCAHNWGSTEDLR